MKLTRNFALIASLVVFATCVGLAWYGTHRAERDVVSSAEAYSVAFTRLASNVLWGRHGAFLESHLPNERPTAWLDLLDQEVRSMLAGLPVAKIKVYASSGLVTYSTERSDIGADRSEKVGFQTAWRGTVVSELQFKGTFNALEGMRSDRNVLETYVPVYGPEGEVRGVIEVYQDLTPVLADIAAAHRETVAVTSLAMLLLLGLLIVFVWRSEVALRQARDATLSAAAEAYEAKARERMKSEFLANVSHELRSPMNAILGFAQVIQNRIFGPIQPDRYENYVNDIVDSGTYLLRTIDDILDMAKIEAKQVELVPTTVDLSDLLNRCVRQVGQAQRQPDVELSVRTPERPVYVVADENRLRQALSNVITNGVMYIRGRGKVTVSLDCRMDGSVAMIVADTGIGIPPDKLEVIQTPFGQVAGAYARESGGVGLGLPIARALMELHGGVLVVESVLRQGTTVTLTLPADRVIGGTGVIGAANAA